MSLLTLNVTKASTVRGNATFRSGIGIARSFSIGDFNGDNNIDFAVGSPGFNSSEGKVDILWGPLNANAINVDNASLIKTTIIPVAGSAREFGYIVQNAGDVNGDGIEDLIGISCLNDGVAYLLYGSHSLPSLLSTADFNTTIGVQFKTITGALSMLGYAAVVGKDINGDGRPDIVLGAPAYRPGTLYDGIIYVVFGKNFSTSTVYLPALNGADGYNITTPLNSNGELGLALEVLDFDNDGIAEIIGGAPYYNQIGGATYDGLVYIVKRGNASFPTINAAGPGNWNITAPLGSNMLFGYAFSVADITGDGRSELTIGAQYFRSSDGAVISIFGNVSFGTYIDLNNLAGKGFNISGAVGSGGRLGRSIAAMDCDQNGVLDLMVSAPRTSASDGAVFCFAANGSTIFKIIGPPGGATYFGEFIQPVQDLNGDGKKDFAIGAYKYNALDGEIFLGLSSCCYYDIMHACMPDLLGTYFNSSSGNTTYPVCEIKTHTVTEEHTLTRAHTATETPTTTDTSTATNSHTFTQTRTFTQTAGDSITRTESITYSKTFSPSVSDLETESITPTSTLSIVKIPTISPTPTPTPTSTSTPTPTLSLTIETDSATATNSFSVLPTATHTLTSSASMKICPAGTYYSQAVCIPCPAGTYNPEEGGSCKPCREEMYNPYVGQTGCIQAPPGSYTDKLTGSIGFNLCPSGSYQPGVGFGNFPVDATTCSFCPQGTYNPDEGKATCISAKRGWYTNSQTGAIRMSTCPVNYSNPEVGFGDDITYPTACIPCTKGSYTTAEASALCIAANYTAADDSNIQKQVDDASRFSKTAMAVAIGAAAVVTVAGVYGAAQIATSCFPEITSWLIDHLQGLAEGKLQQLAGYCGRLLGRKGWDGANQRMHAHDGHPAQDALNRQGVNTQTTVLASNMGSELPTLLYSPVSGPAVHPFSQLEAQLHAAADAQLPYFSRVAEPQAPQMLHGSNQRDDGVEVY